MIDEGFDYSGQNRVTIDHELHSSSWVEELSIDDLGEWISIQVDLGESISKAMESFTEVERVRVHGIMVSVQCLGAHAESDRSLQVRTREEETRRRLPRRTEVEQDFGVDTPDGRETKQGAVGVFAASALNPKEGVQLKDGSTISLAQYTARRDLRLIKASDFNQRLRERGCPKEVAVQKVCKQARDEGEVRELLDDHFDNLLQLYFAYDLGLNCRSEIARGIINHHKLSEEYSTTVMLFVCRILFMLED